MKTVFLLLLAGWGNLLVAQPLNSTVCNSMTLAWEDVSLVGGAGVGPSGILSYTSLRIDGQEVERLVYKVNAPFPKPDYAVQFDESTRKVLQTTGNQVSGTQTYTIRMNVQKVDGSLELEEKATCTRSWAILP